MEESVRRAFGLAPVDTRTVPALTLAYVGDAVYELILRTAMAERGKGRGKKLHDQVQTYVMAVGQAKIAAGLYPLLSEEEQAVYRRGRNAHPESTAKHASLEEYHKATGLEALLGWLYLEGRTERAVELVKEGMHYAENES